MIKNKTLISYSEILINKKIVTLMFMKKYIIINNITSFNNLLV